MKISISLTLCLLCLSFILQYSSQQLPFLQDSNEPLVIKLLEKLISIPSLTNDETQISTFLSEYLRSLNYTVLEQKVENINGNFPLSNRRNIIAYTGPYPTAAKLILTSHIDTVPPFIPHGQNDSIIFGRGSSDAKNCVAAMISAIEEMKLNQEISLNQLKNIALIFVVGEEILGDGMETISKLNFEPNSIIFGEPTENKLVIGHKGLLIFDILSKGKSAHSGYPELGISAINQLLDVLTELKNTNWPSDPIIGLSTLNIGIIEGGTAINVISDFAKAKISLRSAIPILKLKKLIIKMVSKYQGISLDWKGIEINPVKLDIIQGFDTISVSYSTDIPHTHWKGNYKRYLYGGGSISVAHSDHEFITKLSLLQAVQDYKRLIRHALENQT